MIDRFEIDPHSPRGGFIWRVGDNPPSSKRFDALVSLGQLPDNGILSNKLINCFGKQVHQQISEKARKTSRFPFLKKLIFGIETPLAVKQTVHIDAVDQIELLLNARMVSKLRILQETDLCLNGNKHVIDFDAMKTALTQLYAFKEKEIQDPSLNSILISEQEELAYLYDQINQLEQALKKTFSVRERNTLLQQWQRDTFNKLLDRYQENQGLVSLHQYVLPQENRSNTIPLQNAKYFVQDHVYNEITPITSDAIWRNVTAQSFHSLDYPTAQIDKLLFSVGLIDQLGPTVGITLNSLRNPCEALMRQENGAACLRQVQADYEQRKQDIYAKTLALKQTPLPKPLELENNDSPYRHWIQFFHLLDHSTPEREQCLNHSVQILEKRLSALTLPSQPMEKKEAKEDSNIDALLAMLDSEVMQLKLTRTPPPVSHEAFQPGDTGTGFFQFLYAISQFFDRDMNAKHPYVTLGAFMIPSIQMGTLSGATTQLLPHCINQVLNIFTQECAAIQSKLLLGKLSQQQILQATTVIDRFLIKFGHADDAVKALLVCSFGPTQLTYQLADYIANQLLRTQKQNTFDELNETYSEGLLCAMTWEETIKSYAENLTKIILIEAFAIAVGLGISTYDITALNFLSIPLDLLWPVSLYTLGAVKISSLVIGKMMGVGHFSKKGQIVDIDGKTLIPGSASWHVIRLMLTWCELKEIPKQDDHFRRVREHFEELLSKNAQLQFIFKDRISQLRKLDVKTVKPGHLAYFTSLNGRLFFYLIGFICYAPLAMVLWPFLTKAQKDKMPRIIKLCLTVPIHWVARAALLAWMGIKVLLHPFAEIIIRLPELAIGALFLVTRLLIVGKLDTQLKQIQIQALNKIRQWRYFLKNNIVSKLFRTVRDNTVRPVEQALQRIFMDNENTPLQTHAQIANLLPTFSLSPVSRASSTLSLSNPPTPTSPQSPCDANALQAQDSHSTIAEIIGSASSPKRANR